MKLILKNKVEINKDNNESVQLNFSKTNNGYIINGEEINIVDNFRANSYLMVFSNTEGLVYIDGKKLNASNSEIFNVLRYGFKIIDYSSVQILSVWYGSSLEDTTIIVTAPVKFIEEIDYVIDNTNKHNLEIFKEFHPEASELLDVMNFNKKIIRDKYIW